MARDEKIFKSPIVLKVCQINHYLLFIYLKNKIAIKNNVSTVFREATQIRSEICLT